MTLTLSRQRGIALPVMLLMMLTMLTTSIFLIKSINSTTLMSSNLAYESAQAKQADIGLAAAFQWLSSTAATNKPLLNVPQAAQGYLPFYDTTHTVNNPNFWTGSVFIVDAPTNTRVEYVIHRLCFKAGPYDDIALPANKCVLTTDPAGSQTITPGQSLGLGNTNFDSAPQVHYVITSRINGARGGNVVNQLVVLIGA